MDTERSGLDEAMDVGSSTISHLKSLKTAATFSKAGYGAALGGPFSAAIGAVIANRNQFAKILLVILAILLLPVLFPLQIINKSSKENPCHTFVLFIFFTFK